jgi:hypothetical protein
MNSGSGGQLRRIERDVAAQRADGADRRRGLAINGDLQRASIAGA